ncbi:hypothetical protein LSH36_531g01022 [Paralvinella palmiformis]|uniref:Uncharacterized protein n=1 Tax=Paralvinella palmiformis TaxID=53620 RepID=A0AAD9J7H9_9ANNE|nr:hypothetical protein LSH36_531g01022 [Paralvinella palmiformis]
MRMVKAKVVPTRDAQLFRAVAILILVSGAYMLVWTLADPLQPLPLPEQQQEEQGDDVTQRTMTSTVLICISPWWDFIISGGKIHFPKVACNTCLLSGHPALNMNFLLCFLRVQCTVTVTLLLLFVPKFRAVYSTLRELRGTVADVYGAKRVHRLSLMISKNGTIKTIYCIPCGPLTYTEGPEEDTPDSVSEAGDNNKENHYTKAEVDALIEMVSRLKNEKSLYKTQVRRLYHLLKEYKHRLPINSLPVYLVAETPEREDLPNPDLLPAIEGLPIPDTPGDCPGGNIWQDLSSTSAYSSSRTLPNESPDPRAEIDGQTSRAGCDPDFAGLGETNYGCALMSHSRKASTVTTYLSNTSENNSWTGDGSDVLEEDLLRYTKTRDIGIASGPNCVTSPVSDYSSCQDSLPVDYEELALDDGCQRPANRAHLALDIARTDAGTPRSPQTDELDDYPRIIDTNAHKTQQDCSQDIQDFISTICGNVKDKAKTPRRAEPDVDEPENDVIGKSHEMDTLKNGRSNNILSNAVKLSAKAFDRRQKGSRKASDKMSFVMYI